MRAMRFTLIFLLSSALLFPISKSSAARDETPIRCERGGLGGNPLVPDAATAKAIFVAVARAVWPDNLRTFPVVVAEDKGDHWEVGDERRKKPVRLNCASDSPQSIIVMAGGGMLSMNIDKCTGAISDAQGNK